MSWAATQSMLFYLSQYLYLCPRCLPPYFCNLQTALLSPSHSLCSLAMCWQKTGLSFCVSIWKWNQQRGIRLSIVCKPGRWAVEFKWCWFLYFKFPLHLTFSPPQEGHSFTELLLSVTQIIFVNFIIEISLSFVSVSIYHWPMFPNTVLLWTTTQTVFVVVTHVHTAYASHLFPCQYTFIAYSYNCLLLFLWKWLLLYCVVRGGKPTGGTVLGMNLNSNHERKGRLPFNRWQQRAVSFHFKGLSKL
jgi:hypothetical protein